MSTNLSNPIQLNEIYSSSFLFILNKLNLNSITFQTILWIPIKHKKLRYPSGILIEDQWFMNNKSHGPYKIYYSVQNQAAMHFWFKNNKKHGKCIEYEPNGCVSKEHYYENNFLYHTILYYPSGKIKKDTKYYKDS